VKYHKSYCTDNIFPLPLIKNNCKKVETTLPLMMKFYESLKEVNKQFYSFITRESGDSDFHKHRVGFLNAAYKLYKDPELRQKHNIDVKDCVFVMNGITIIDKHHMINSVYKQLTSVPKKKKEKKEEKKGASKCRIPTRFQKTFTEFQKTFMEFQSPGTGQKLSVRGQGKNFLSGDRAKTF